MTTRSVQVLTCDAYGCPGRESSEVRWKRRYSRLTEVPGAGFYSREQLALLGRAALATGAITPDH